MSVRAWIYIWLVLLVGALLAVLALLGEAPSSSQWLAFGVLTTSATITQQFEAKLGRQSYYPSIVFQFAGVLLLPPLLFILLVTIPHLIEWAKKRWINSEFLRDWYIQPFNIAVHIIAGILTHGLLLGLGSLQDQSFSYWTIFTLLLAGLGYIILNHFLVGQALVLARNISWRDSQIMSLENILTEFILFSLGCTVAILWQVNSLLILLATSPLVLLYQALRVPQLKQEAQTDSKTGLFNARHFNAVFGEEFERARRFNRPLAIIMADLDLMRNINNTYGHLAGDVVLKGVGDVIRKTIRDYDIAGRFGGEEFAIGLPETNITEARGVAERIRQAIENTPFEVPTSVTPIHATLSIGVACFPHDSTSVTDLTHAADVAVYQAKFLGRNRVICAADIPHSAKIEPLLAPEPVVAIAPSARDSDAPQAAISTERAVLPPPERSAASPTPPPTTETTTAAAATQQPQTRLWIFVSGVISAGIMVSILGLWYEPRPDFTVIGLLTVLAFLAEMFQINLYGSNTLSVSVAVAFAAALVAGVPGIICTSAAIALAHNLRQRPPLYRTGFNWSTHILAGALPAFARSLFSFHLDIIQSVFLVIPFIFVALTYYAIETGLVAAATSLSSGMRITIVWQQRFQWLASHYVILCGIGLFMAIALSLFGTAGIAVCALPLFMMRYVQQQYVTRTQESVFELQRMNEELAQANNEIVFANRAIQQLNHKLHELNDGLFLTLGNILDARDPYVHGHAAQVASYATALAIELGLPPERVEQVRQAAFLHDIGKIAIAEQVLHKPDKLTPEEYEYIKTHAPIGASLLQTSKALAHLAPFVRHHHERWDGAGYPDGLAGEAIPLEARILNVCDSVEAMASDRPYHQGMSARAIRHEIRRCAGTQFDPAITEAFLRIFDREGDQFVPNSALNVRLHIVEHPLRPPPHTPPAGLHQFTRVMPE